jgi:hypothetical protein
VSEDIIARIDQALGCHWCGKPLKPDGPSPDFCKYDCQQAWHERRRTAQVATPGEIEAVAASSTSMASAAVADEALARLVAAEEAAGRGYAASLVIVDAAPCQRGWFSRWVDRIRGVR